MNTCTKVRALRSCSGDVHVARVVVSLVVHAVVGLTLGLIAHVVVVVFVILGRWCSGNWFRKPPLSFPLQVSNFSRYRFPVTSYQFHSFQVSRYTR